MVRSFRIYIEEGFTLIEVLVAIVIIVVGVLGMSLNTIGVIQGNQISGNITVANSLAQDRMEALLVQTSFSNGDSNCPGDLTNIPFSSPADSNITATGASGGIYNRCYNISDSGLGSDLKQIDVTVSWRDYLTRSLTLSSLVFVN